MRVHVLQHVPFEEEGSIRLWARSRGHELSHTRFFETDWTLPALSVVDMLVVMGGPMSVHDEAEFGWLAKEKEFIRACIASGRKVLGICLGAQLAAEALGGIVSKNPHKEIGWHPVKRVASHALTRLFPGQGMVFHWHGETFSLPEGAVHLLASEACANQAFCWRDQVLALQCHLEMGMGELKALTRHCAAELEQGGAYVQDAETILSLASHASPMQLWLEHMLDSLVQSAIRLEQGAA